MIALRQFRSRAAGLADLLNYAAVVDDGIVLNKDGSLMAAWYYRGNDNASSTDREREHVSVRVNAALARLGTGWATHTDAVRVPSTMYPDPARSFFPDPVTRLTDEERRSQFEAEGSHYESLYALCVTYMPPTRQQSKLTDLLYDDDTAAAPKSVASRTLEYFKGVLMEMEDGLGGVLALRRMQGVGYTDPFGQEHIADEFLQYLNFCVTGDMHPINLPPVPMYLDAVIGSREFLSGVTPKIGERLLGVVAIDGFPFESYPGMLAILDQLPMAYRWSTRFIYLDRHEADSELKKYQRKWKQKVRGWFDQVFQTSNKGRVNQDAAEMAADIDEAIAENASGTLTYGYYTSVVTLLHEERDVLEESLRELRRSVQNLGFACRIEGVNAVEAWLGSLPGHVIPNIRRPLMHTMNLADLLPLSSVWPGAEFAPCPFYPPGSPPLAHAATDGATPFRLNLHVGDLGHTFIVGPTGSGKSTLLTFLAAQFRRYSDATIFCFDKGNSMFALSKACGGSHFDIAGPDSQLTFCPLADIESDADLAWAEEWIATLIELQGVKMVPHHRSAIHHAMLLTRDAPRDGRSLTDFSTNVQDNELREALKPYTLEGSLGHLLDSPDDSLELGSFQVFEVENLMHLGDKNVIPVLLYLFHRMEKALTGQPAMLQLDEAWLMLTHPVFKQKIREWLKVLRKANCVVVLATQSLSDAANSGILDVLLESCPTKILLANENAQQSGAGGMPGPREFYAMLGLNDRQVEILAGATPKRHYYFWSAEGRRLIDLNLGPIALSFLGASGKQDIARIKQLAAEHGQDWPWRWLDERRVAYGHLLGALETAHPQFAPREETSAA